MDLVLCWGQYWYTGSVDLVLCRGQYWYTGSVLVLLGSVLVHRVSGLVDLVLLGSVLVHRVSGLGAAGVSIATCHKCAVVTARVRFSLS